MPEISDLILTIVKPLIVHDDKMSIEIKETSEFMEYHLHLDAEDVGRVIGKQGRIAKAIRSVVKAAASKEDKKVIVEIVQ